ncbi:MAG: hypothetical protein ABJ013_06520 [Halioglobus sp.]
MEAIDVIKAELEPKFNVLLMYLEAVQDMQAHQFFASIANNLLALQQEEQVLELFIQLSMTAFQPFVLDPFAVHLTDDILAYAQQVSEAYSADTGISH